jgi:hypothetical protein
MHMVRNDRISTGRRLRAGALLAAGAAVAGAAMRADAVDGPSLGAARTFAVLGASEVASTGLSAVTGDVGVSPGSAINGFPPATATGSFHSADDVAAAAHADAGLAYTYLAGLASLPANNLSDTDLGGLTLDPGVYKFDAAAGLTGALTLDAGGDSDAVFVIQIASSLTTASGASVVVINGGGNYDESNVFWQVGSSATLGLGTAFTGNILAYASITLDTGSTMTGNALALNGVVSLDASTVVSPAGGVELSTRPTQGRVKLLPPGTPAGVKANARLDVKHFPAKAARPERSWFRVKARHLDGLTTYTLWADDPSTAPADLVQFDSFTTKKKGNFNYTQDTKHGGELPFGATLDELAGRPVEVRNAAGTTTVLEGTIPTTLP